MRNGVAVLLLVALVAAVAVALKGGGSSSAEVQDFGVAVAVPVATLRSGQELCEEPVGLLDDVAKVTFNPGAVGGRTPAIDVRLRSFGRGRRVLGGGVVPADFDPAVPQTVDVGRVQGGQLVSLCFRNRGPQRVNIFGDEQSAPAGCTPTGRQATGPVACRPEGLRPTLSTADPRLDGGKMPLRGDIAATFLAPKSRTLLDRVPQIAARASVFRPGFVTPDVWWVLLAAWLLALPAGLAFALASSPVDAE